MSRCEIFNLRSIRQFPPYMGGCLDGQQETTPEKAVPSLYGRMSRVSLSGSYSSTWFPPYMGGCLESIDTSTPQGRCSLPIWEDVSLNSTKRRKDYQRFPPYMGGCLEIHRPMTRSSYKFPPYMGGCLVCKHWRGGEITAFPPYMGGCLAGVSMGHTHLYSSLPIWEDVSCSQFLLFCDTVVPSLYGRISRLMRQLRLSNHWFPPCMGGCFDKIYQTAKICKSSLPIWEDVMSNFLHLPPIVKSSLPIWEDVSTDATIIDELCQVPSLYGRMSRS